MSDEFISGNTSKKITVTNNINESINISWYLDNPTQDLIRENKTIIPDLSWLSIEPKWKIIPPDSEARFFIYLDIPDERESYNKSWEVWPVFRQNASQFFNWEHAVRLYIDTPDKGLNEENKNQDCSYLIITFILIICIVIVISIFIVKRTKNKKS
jgi:hypothetical protein